MNQEHRDVDACGRPRGAHRVDVEMSVACRALERAPQRAGREESRRTFGRDRPQVRKRFRGDHYSDARVVRGLLQRDRAAK